MIDFVFHAPTKVVFGHGVEARAGELVRAAGGHRALLHYGGGSAERSGLLGRLRESLQKAGVPFVELGGVQANPRLSLVREGVALCRSEGVDFLLAAGGGSVIDSAKSIGYGLANDCDVWEIFERRRKPVACTPIGTVPTIAAAGSETAMGAVLTNDEGRLKRAYNDPLAFPVFALLDPELTFSLPRYQTACGAADIMMHTLERYFTPVRDTMPLTDEIAEAVLRRTMAAAAAALKDPRDYDARAELMWASNISHDCLTECGGGHGDWAMHQLSHELGGAYDAAHGAGLSAIWGAWAREVMPVNPARFAQLAVRVMGVERGDENETALAGIAALEDFFRSMGLPVNLKELGVPTDEASLRELAFKCTYSRTRTIGNFKELGEDDIYRVYRAACGV